MNGPNKIGGQHIKGSPIWGNGSGSSSYMPNHQIRLMAPESITGLLTGKNLTKLYL